MRVALVSDWFLPRAGGIELHLRDLAATLRTGGIDARIVTTTRGPEEVDGIPVHRLAVPLAPLAGVAFTPGALSAVARSIREEGFDVVHAHASVVSPLAVAGAIAARRAGLPSILTFHSMLHRAAFVLGASEALFGWTERGVVLSAVSSVVAEQATRWMPDASVAVLPNGVDVRFWRDLPRRATGDDVVFVSAMRLTRKKRPLLLIRAFAEAVRFVAGTPSLRLVVAGDGPARAAMLRLAKELGVHDRVTLAGARTRTELRELYAGAHAFILPSERESFGVAALEARAAGLPVIAMLATGVRDFIRHGVDGLLARDERDLARQIARLALDVPFRAYVLSRNASTAPPYDWSEVRELHLAMYAHAARAR
jgi:glycosyltransferase involved in cell wall biosynthesis